jgi:hypothetical protein
MGGVCVLLFRETTTAAAFLTVFLATFAIFLAILAFKSF